MIDETKEKKSLRIFVAGHKGMVGSAIVKCLNKIGYKNLILLTRKELDLIDQVEVFRKEIEEKDKKIEDEKTLLSPEVYQERKIALQQEANAKQQELQARGQEIEQAVQKASGTIQSVMKPILEGIVDEKGAKILLDRQVVITGDPKLDISAEVVKKLNKRLLAEDLRLNISE